MLIAVTVLLGLLAFWQKREVLNQALTNDSNLEVEIREQDFPNRFPRIHKIPIFGLVARWAYKEGYPYNLLFFVFIVLLAVAYFSHIGTIKFIDTDEGRLFDDGKLILEGQIPFKDFNARAPFIIYFLAGFIALSGGSLFLMYSLSVLLVLVSVILLYILSKRIFNKKIALTAMLVFGFAPIVIMGIDLL